MGFSLRRVTTPREWDASPHDGHYIPMHPFGKPAGQPEDEAAQYACWHVSGQGCNAYSSVEIFTLYCPCSHREKLLPVALSSLELSLPSTLSSLFLSLNIGPKVQSFFGAGTEIHLSLIDTFASGSAFDYVRASAVYPMYSPTCSLCVSAKCFCQLVPNGRSSQSGGSIQYQF